MFLTFFFFFLLNLCLFFDKILFSSASFDFYTKNFIWPTFFCDLSFFFFTTSYFCDFSVLKVVVGFKTTSGR